MGAYLYCLILGTVIKINKLTEAMRVKKNGQKLVMGSQKSKNGGKKI